MEFNLKKLSPAGIDDALRKAERYRLLNEPWEAESICLDILEADPGNQRALVALLLSLTDQFRSARGASVADARALLPKLESEYDRAYYAGIICERRGSSLLEQASIGSGAVAYDWLTKAMRHYEDAERLRPDGNDSALLRWNTCARAIMRHPGMVPAGSDAMVGQAPLE
jgi:hypothetical protein